MSVNNKIFMKKTIIISLLIVLVAIITFFVLKNIESEKEETEKIDYYIHSSELYTDFKYNRKTARTKYYNKKLQIKGVVKEIYTREDNTLRMIIWNENYNGINCIVNNLQDIDKPIKLGSEVILAGRCVGMKADVMMMDCMLLSF